MILPDIPFLPVEFFRNHKIITGDRSVEMIFESSGTSGTIPGKHFVTDLKIYEESFLKSFHDFLWRSHWLSDLCITSILY